MARRFSRVGTIGALVAGALLLSVVAGPAQAATPTASISGVVTSAATGQPVAGVRVYEARDGIPSEYFSSSTVTDASGAYSITGLWTGSYGLLFEPPRGSGLAAEWWPSTYDRGRATTIDVTDGAVTVADAALNKATASISGHVSVPAGVNADYATVRAFEADEPGYIVGWADVNADGNYSMTGLPADDYKLLFDDQYDHLTTRYWDAATTFETASVVSLADDEARTGIDASLDHGSTIAGRLSGGHIANGWGHVRAYRLTDAGAFEQGISDRDFPVAADGTFTVTGLNPGSYKLEFQDYNTCGGLLPDSFGGQSWAGRRFWWNDQFTSQTATVITVTDHQHVTGLSDDLNVTGGRSSRPSVSGTTVVGQTLRVNPGAWAPGTQLKYLWMAGGEWVPGATSSSLTVTSAQAGQTITAWVLGQATGPQTPTCESEWDQQTAAFTTKVATAATPTISGTRALGFRLTVNHGTWTPGTTFTYAWYANGAYIPGSVGHTTFTPGSAQLGKAISARVVGTKAGYPTVSRMSARTAKIARTALPTITGRATVGYTLTAHTGVWTTGTHFTYAWYADGVYIPGSVGHSTLKLAKAQGEKEIRVKVTGSLAGYQTIARMSAPTAWVTRW